MFDSIPSHYLLIGSTIMAVLMGSFVMFIRLRAQKSRYPQKNTHPAFCDVNRCTDVYL